jgi:hypothetical protein
MRTTAHLVQGLSPQPVSEEEALQLSWRCAPVRTDARSCQADTGEQDEQDEAPRHGRGSRNDRDHHVRLFGDLSRV